MFQTIQQNGRRILIIGDIHGCLSKMLNALDQVGFELGKDILVSVGDLTDRGPQNTEVLDWFIENEKHGVISIMGNHDEWVACTASMSKEHFESSGEAQNWVRNGGMWILDEVPYGLLQRYGEWMVKRPYMIELQLDSGSRFGVVHAEIWEDWGTTRMLLNNNCQITKDRLVWGRTKINQFRQNKLYSEAKGIDVLFCGHSVVTEATEIRNQVYLDTGAVFSTLYDTEHKGHFTIAVIEPNSGEYELVRCSV